MKSVLASSFAVLLGLTGTARASTINLSLEIPRLQLESVVLVVTKDARGAENLELRTFVKSDGRGFVMPGEQVDFTDIQFSRQVGCCDIEGRYFKLFQLPPNAQAHLLRMKDGSLAYGLGPESAIRFARLKFERTYATHTIFSLEFLSGVKLQDSSDFKETKSSYEVAVDYRIDLNNVEYILARAEEQKRRLAELTQLRQSLRQNLGQQKVDASQLRSQSPGLARAIKVFTVEVKNLLVAEVAVGAAVSGEVIADPKQIDKLIKALEEKMYQVAAQVESLPYRHWLDRNLPEDTYFVTDRLHDLGDLYFLLVTELDAAALLQDTKQVHLLSSEIFRVMMELYLVSGRAKASPHTQRTVAGLTGMIGVFAALGLSVAGFQEGHETIKYGDLTLLVASGWYMFYQLYARDRLRIPDQKPAGRELYLPGIKAWAQYWNSRKLTNYYIDSKLDGATLPESWHIETGLPDDWRTLAEFLKYSGQRGNMSAVERLTNIMKAAATSVSMHQMVVANCGELLAPLKE